MKRNRNKEKHIAFNTHMLLDFVLLLIFVGASVFCALEKEVVLAVCFGIFAVLPISVFLISPICFVFDNDAVKIVYNFGQSETVYWDSVRSISSAGSLIGGGGLPHYVLSFPRTEKRRFFVTGEITKTRKTTKLINRYYKKGIN